MNDEALIRDLEEIKNSLLSDRLDMSIGEIIGMYERDELIIDPEYQRLFRWDDFQKTRFIESILLGIPIPPIFVAENKIGQWEVVDGLQRISTILSFYGNLKTSPDKNSWQLGKGELIQLLEGYSYEKLPLKLKLNVKRAVCRVEVIKWNSKIDLRYELFNRLNTGGEPLTDQEIRNCIFRGVTTKFNDMLKELSENDDFIDLIKPTNKQVEELYLQELVLRFISLCDKWEDINEVISTFMTMYMKESINNKDYNYNLWKNIFLKTLNLFKNINGWKILRGVNNVFSTSLYDSIFVSIGIQIEKIEKLENTEIINKIEKIKNDPEIKQFYGSGAQSKVRVHKRIERALVILG